MASSMTMPTMSVSASMVIWLSVNPSAAMTAKAPMIDVGNGDGGDERRAEVAQEDEDDDRGEDAAEHEVFLDRGERRLDELRVVADEADFDVRRQRLLNLDHPCLDRVGKRHRIDAALLPDGDSQRRLAVEHRDRRRILAAVDDAADVADADWRVAARGDDEIVEGVGRAQPADRPHRQVAVALLQPSAGQLEILRPQRRRDVGGREPVGIQAVGIDLDLDLTSSRAEEQHFADAVDRLEPLLHVLLEERRQFHDRHRRRYRKHDDRHGIRVLLLDDGRIRGFRQISNDRVDLGPDFLCRDVGVLREVEGDGDARAAFRGRRAKLVDAGDGVDGSFDPVSELGLDVLRRRARVRRRDRHDRRLDTRVAIDAEREERHAADDGNGRDEHRGKDRPVNADFSELLHDDSCYSREPRVGVHGFNTKARSSRRRTKIVGSSNDSDAAARSR